MKVICAFVVVYVICGFVAEILDKNNDGPAPSCERYVDVGWAVIGMVCLYFLIK